MVDLQTISIGLATLSFILAITYYTFNIRHARQTRQAQLFMQLTSQIFTKDAMSDNIDLLDMKWDDLKDFYRKYDSSVNKDNFVKRFLVWYRYDQIGFLLYKGLIDRDFTYALMGGMNASWVWNKFEPVIKHQRVHQNMPELATWFEYLAKELEKINIKRGYETSFRADPSIYPEDINP